MPSVFAVANHQNSQVTASLPRRPFLISMCSRACPIAAGQADASCDICAWLRFKMNLECDWSTLDHPLLNQLLQDRRNAQYLHLHQLSL